VNNRLSLKYAEELIALSEKNYLYLIEPIFKENKLRLRRIE
jgi:hypothetical protein